MVPHSTPHQQQAVNGLATPVKATCDGDKFEKFEILKERFKTFGDKRIVTTNDEFHEESIEMLPEQNQQGLENEHHQQFIEHVQNQINASIAFMTVETDLKEIRDFLRVTRKRMEDREAKAKTVNDWKQVALVLDRTFFFVYLTAIIISLAVMIPR